MAYLKSDDQGFLTGKRLKNSDLVDEFKAMEKSLRSIERTVGGIMALLRGMNTKPSESASTAQARAVTPVGGKRKQPEVKVNIDVKTDEKKAAFFRPRDADGRFISVSAVEPKTKTEGRIPTKSATSETVPSARRYQSEETSPTKPSESEGNPVRRAEKGRFVRGSESEKAKPQKSVIPEQNKARRAPRTDAEKEGGKERKRNSKGQFVKNGDGENPLYGAAKSILADRFASKVGEAVAEGTSDVAEADPAVMAMQEAVTPFVRGYKLVSDALGNDDQEGWLKKIYRLAQRKFRSDKAYAEADKKANKELLKESKKQSRFAAMKQKLKGIGSSISDSVSGMMSAVGGAIGGMVTKLGGVGGILGGVAKKVPLLGSIFSLGKGIFDVTKIENDPTLSRREKDTKGGKAAVGAIGATGGLLAGAKAGALAGSFFGPIGTAVGTIVGGAAGAFFAGKAGETIGETVGGWVSDLREFDLGGKIASAWDNTVGYVADKWDQASAYVADAWDGVASKVSSVWNGITETVSGAWDSVTGTITETWDSVTSGILGAWDSAVGVITGTWDTVTGTLKGFWDSAKKTAESQLRGINDWISNTLGIDLGAGLSKAGEFIQGAAKGMLGAAKEFFTFGKKKEEASATPQSTAKKSETANGDWKLGQTSARFESGGRGAGTISKGYGDRGGKSYGTYQLAGNTGTLKEFLDQSKYGAEFDGLKIGSAAFDAKWKELADKDPEFAKEQHDFVKRTHYDKAMAGLAEAGLDMSGRGKAVQDAIWSTSVQFGAGSAKSRAGAVPMMKAALAGRDVSKMSDADIITALQDYKLANNDRFFLASSKKVREGTAKRASLEKEELLLLAQEEDEQKNKNSGVKTMAGAAVLAKYGLDKGAEKDPNASYLNDEAKAKAEARAQKAAEVSANVDRVDEQQAVEASKVDTRGRESYRRYLYDKSEKTGDIGNISISGRYTELQDYSETNDAEFESSTTGLYGPDRNFESYSVKVGNKVVTGDEARDMADRQNAESDDKREELERRRRRGKGVSKYRYRNSGKNVRKQYNGPSDGANEQQGTEEKKAQYAPSTRVGQVKSAEWFGTEDFNSAAPAKKPVEASYKVPTTPTVSKPAPAPAPVQTPPAPLNSGKANVSANVKIGGDVGQDVKDRGVAHIATGGLSQPSW